MNTDITSHGNPTQIKKLCEWTGKEFWVDWKHRHQRFIDKNAMYEWRKSQNHEIVKCPTCGKSFERYKNILWPSTGKPTQYCSNKCSQLSNVVREKKRMWTVKNQPMNNPLSVKKISETKQKRYGDPNYNNMEKNKQTCMTRYGVPYSVYLPQCMSNGIRISKFQRRVYDDVIKIYMDAKLEVYLSDVQKSVDIFIPTENKVIECQGDYWHCNPSSFKPNYYNNMIHLTAQQIWNRDAEKKRLLESAGYKVEVIWENTNKHFKHSTK
jgi:hypothetical protein